MATNSSEVSKAQENVLGGRQNPVSIYDEPVSGVQGAGTADRPYDQGNQAEQAAGPGIEPPSGQTGKGTPTQPYDQGNQPGSRSIRCLEPQTLANAVYREHAFHRRQSQQNQTSSKSSPECKSNIWKHHHLQSQYIHSEWNHHSTNTNTIASTNASACTCVCTHNTCVCPWPCTCTCTCTRTTARGAKDVHSRPTQ